MFISTALFLMRDAISFVNLTIFLLRNRYNKIRNEKRTIRKVKITLKAVIPLRNPSQNVTPKKMKITTKERIKYPSIIPRDKSVASSSGFSYPFFIFNAYSRYLKIIILVYSFLLKNDKI